MTRFMEDRAPLEFTTPSKKQMIVGCPNCKTARSVSVDWWGSICSRCNTYFNKDTMISTEECESVLNKERPIDTEYTARKSEMEKKAYAYKENVMDKKKSGNYVNHEPR